ncbi:unnamed protein product [Peniophora sp. CBMAI 1063]|nr:unnamed protein product [Peniophora sp. CBMAI 1063]
MSQITLLSNTFVDDQSAKIRAKEVPWPGYQRAGLITPDELALIKRVERQSRAKTEGILLSDGPAYALLYLRLLKKLQRVDTMQWVLVMIADALTDHDERIPLFTRTAETDPELPYTPLLRAFETQDDFVLLKSAQILTVLLGSEPNALGTNVLLPLLHSLSSFVQSPSSNKRDVAVQCLESLLPRPEVRQAVWANPGIISGLVDILKSKPGPQMSYQVGFCFWLLSFEQNIAQQINKKFDIIPLFVDVAKAAVKEKVIRVIIATFSNLVSKAPTSNLPSLLTSSALPFLTNLSSRKYTDPDIPADLSYLIATLTSAFDSLTTWDHYTSELESGHLSWSPVHESEGFWKENAVRLGEGDGRALRRLVGLVMEGRESLVLAVGCHDLGQYVKYYQPGKKVLTDLGAKTRVMELMAHADADVRYQALLAVQQLVSHPWQAV